MSYVFYLLIKCDSFIMLLIGVYVLYHDVIDLFYVFMLCVSLLLFVFICCCVCLVCYVMLVLCLGRARAACPPKQSYLLNSSFNDKKLNGSKERHSPVN